MTLDEIKKVLFPAKCITVLLLGAALCMAAVPGALAQSDMAKASRKTSNRKSVAITQSFFLPGMGQHYNGQHKKGFLIQAAFGAAFAVFYSGQQSGNEISDKYEIAEDAYHAAIAPEEIDRYFAEMESHYQDHEDAMVVRNVGIVCAGLIWAYNVFDAARGGGAAESQDDTELSEKHQSEWHAGLAVSIDHNVRLGFSCRF
jgi:Family of unknown function (DUF5683)